MDKAQLIEDYKVMTKSDFEHLQEALKAGNRTAAARYTMVIVDNVQALSDMGVKDVELA